ncbi:MAG: hypothetical protein WCJ25_03475 [Candidatus Moraniibacteriota bacterium]
MDVPKVVFSEVPLSLEVEMLRDFLSMDDYGFAECVTRKHPNLGIVHTVASEAEQAECVRKYVVRFRTEHRETIETCKERFRKDWEPVETEYFTALSEILQTRWPKERSEIQAMVSIDPISPRFLSDWSFIVCFDYASEAIREIVMHECVHFLYFEKWKQLFPDMDPELFESPHLEWHLSEIVAPIVLNDSRIQRLLQRKASFYGIHEQARIGTVSATEFFQDLYDKQMATDGFESFLSEAYYAIKKNRDSF